MARLFDDLLETIAELICGDNDEYPYRTGSQLTRFFNSIGYPHLHDGSTRKYWVLDVLKRYNFESK